MLGHRLMEKNIRLLNEGKMIPKVPVNDLMLSKIMNDLHYEVGFVMISSYCPDLPRKDNEISFIWLKSKVVDGGYGYIPLFGEYIENKGELTESIKRVPALIILNYKIGTSQPFDGSQGLKNYAIELMLQLQSLGGEEIGGTYLSNPLNIGACTQEFFLYKPQGANTLTLFNTEGEGYKKIEHVSQKNIGTGFFELLFNNCSFEDCNYVITPTDRMYINKNPGDLVRANRRYGEKFFDLEHIII